MDGPIEVADGLVRQGFLAVRLSQVCGISVGHSWVYVGMDSGAQYAFLADSDELAQQAAQAIIAQMEDHEGYSASHGAPRAWWDQYQS